MITIEDILKSIALEANKNLSVEQLQKLVRKYRPAFELWEVKDQWQP